MKRYTIYDIRYTRHGFTLVELLLALTVASIVLAAVTTLAFALSSAASSSDDTAREQAELRYATLRVTELLRNCKLICGTPDGDLVVWRADTKANNQVDVNEVVYIECGTNRDYLSFCEFDLAGTGTRTLAELSLASTKSTLQANYNWTRTYLLPQCSDVQFYLHRDQPGDPIPRVKRVSIAFDLTEDNVTHHYQISCALHCWAGNLLSSDGQSIVSDDD